MKNYIIFVFMVYAVLIGCSKKEIALSNEIVADDDIIYHETSQDIEKIAKNDIVRNNITDFFIMKY